ncbi:SGF11 [Acrasis kona]|uniref:SAGA-associated factor 11 n=1 Tax=Acrasis kona TaxID=1008807 RepID=A0AAW2YRC1_9EUKA
MVVTTQSIVDEDEVLLVLKRKKEMYQTMINISKDYPMSVDIYDDILSEITFEMCFQHIKHERRKNVEKETHPQLHETVNDRRGRTDIFRIVHPRKYESGEDDSGVDCGTHFQCDHCGNMISGARYASHLERCMTKPRAAINDREKLKSAQSPLRRSKRTSKRLYSDNLYDELINDQEYENDEDFQEETPKKKRRTSNEGSKKKRNSRRVVGSDNEYEQDDNDDFK